MIVVVVVIVAAVVSAHPAAADAAAAVVAAAAPAVVLVDGPLGCDVRFVAIGRFDKLGGGSLKSGGNLFFFSFSGLYFFFLSLSCQSPCRLRLTRSISKQKMNI